MLPWRVQLQRTLEAFRQDPSFRNRLLGVLVVLTLLVGSFATGIEVNIKIGDTGSESATSLAGQQLDGAAPGATVAGGESPQAGSSGADIGGGADGPIAAGDGSRNPGSRADAGSNQTGTKPAAAAAGASYDQMLRAQLAKFTAVRSCSGSTPTASDRGITAKEIKLGWLIPNLNELKAAGFEVGLAGDWDRIISAWVKELNRLGGWCRKVTYVKEIFDVLSVDDMIAKCKAMVDDHKVFAVFTPGGYDSVAQLCVAKDGRTPFINPEPEPASWYPQAAPYLWNMLMTKDRMHRNHVRWLTESGSLKPSHKVGVVYHDIPNVGPAVRAALLTELKKQGIDPLRVVALSSDDEQAVAQINQVVVQFQQAGIDYVFMPMNLIFKSQFMQQAEKQQYFPEYTDSDHYFGCFDFVTAAYSASSWDGTKCVSAVDVAGIGEVAAKKLAAVHPYAKYADQVYARAFPDGYDKNGEANEDTADTQRALFIGTGEQVLLFKQAADRAGVNMTRPRWGAEMGRTGKYCTVIRYSCVSFGPKKWDAPDHINVNQWSAAAKDGYPERAYHQIVKPFPAYY